MKTYINIREKNKDGVYAIKVYRIKNNTPLYIGEKENLITSNKTREQEAYEVLLNEGEVSKKGYEKSGGYYNAKFPRDFKIISLS